MVEIDKDIPPPCKEPVYPFNKMKVGDSVFYEVADDKSFWQSKVIVAAYKYGKRSNKRFTVRRVDGGARIWRTS